MEDKEFRDIMCKKKKELLFAIDPAIDRIAFQHTRMEDLSIDCLDIVKENNHTIMCLINILRLDRRPIGDR